MENRLRILRTQHNWSQAKLAELLKVSRQTINAIEKGKYDPSLPLAIKISRLFDCPIETIFFFAENSEEGTMFDKFTSKAVQVIMLAQEETRRLKHNYVGTEQIFIGLIAQDSGIAGRVLKSAGVKLDAARKEVKKIIGYGKGNVGPEIPFTPRGKFVLDYSLDESRKLGHDYVGTEHLLLGLLRVVDGVAFRVLQTLEIDTNNLRQKVLEEITPGEFKPPKMTSSARETTPQNEEYSTPIDFTSGVISARFCRILSSWVESRQLGYVVSSNSGFQRFNGEIIAPHIAFYSRDRLKQIPRTYPEVLPNLVVEIKSAFEQLMSLQPKIFRFLELGITTAMLINPDERTVYVYVFEPDRKHIVNILKDGDKLTLPELLPEWEVEVSELWAPTFS